MRQHIHNWRTIVVCFLLGVASAATAFADLKSEARDLYKKGQFAAALEKYRAAAHERPTDPSIFWNLGFTYRKLERYLEALQSFEKAGKLDPTLSFASSPKKFDETIAAVKKKIRTTPKRPVAKPAAAASPLGKMPEVIALKSGNLYIAKSREKDVEREALAKLAHKLNSQQAHVKLAVLDSSYRGDQLMRFAGAIHKALALGSGYLLVATKNGCAASSDAATPEQLASAARGAAPKARHGDAAEAFQLMANDLIKPGK